MIRKKNHYDWLEEHLETIFNNLNLDYSHHCGIIRCHGDKAYLYRQKWERHSIHFFHGIAIYLLSYVYPYSNECRNTKEGWIPVDNWVVNNYERFKKHLPEAK